MSRKDEALRQSMVFLLTLWVAASEDSQPEFKKALKAHADLCAVVLPMKYRLSRDEYARIVKGEDKP